MAAKGYEVSRNTIDLCNRLEAAVEGTTFVVSEAKEMGSKGGSANTEAQRLARAANGKLGGRPPKLQPGKDLDQLFTEQVLGLTRPPKSSFSPSTQQDDAMQVFLKKSEWSLDRLEQIPGTKRIYCQISTIDPTSNARRIIVFENGSSEPHAICLTAIKMQKELAGKQLL